MMAMQRKELEKRSSCYKIRNPKYVLPWFKYEVVRKDFHYNLIVIINNTPSFVFEKIYPHSIQGFALYIKQYNIGFLQQHMSC